MSHDCSAVTSCPSLSSALAPLANGGPDYSARSAPASHIRPAFVTVSCKPWGFDYVNAIARYFWQGAMSNCEKMFQNNPSTSKTSNNSPCGICGYDFDAVPFALGNHAKQPCDTIIDIGANQGWWMLPPTSRCFRVLAIEPVLANVHQLKLNATSTGLARSGSASSTRPHPTLRVGRRFIRQRAAPTMRRSHARPLAASPTRWR